MNASDFTRSFSVLACLLLGPSLGCGGADEPQSSVDVAVGGPETAAPYYQQGQPPQQPQQQGGGVVTIFDHGMQMARSTITVPPGWTVNQNVATDPNNGQYVRFQLDQVGPQGELIRDLPPANYEGNFEQTWRRTVQYSLQGALENVSFGQLQPSAELQSDPRVQQAMRQNNVQPLEAQLSASRGGTAYGGKVYLINAPFPPSQSGMFYATIVASPTPLVQQTLRTAMQTAKSTRPNPQFEAAYAQIHQRVMQQMTSSHEARMRNNQAAFDSHQKAMKTQREGFYRSNEQWQQNFNNSWNTGQPNTGYSQNDAFIDGVITERDAFTDPYTGNQIKLDGHHDRTFTDGLGNFHRTDDPSFDPNSMQGNWQEIQPLRPE